jgi:hypothetical protein
MFAFGRQARLKFLDTRSGSEIHETRRILPLKGLTCRETVDCLTNGDRALIDGVEDLEATRVAGVRMVDDAILEHERAQTGMFLGNSGLTWFDEVPRHLMKLDLRRWYRSTRTHAVRDDDEPARRYDA